MGEKSQWKWLWISLGLSYSILTQEGTAGLSGEAALTCEGISNDSLAGVSSTLRQECRSVDTGGRTAAVLVVLLVKVWLSEGFWEFACNDSWSSPGKNEGRGRVVEEVGWCSRPGPKLPG